MKKIVIKIPKIANGKWSMGHGHRGKGSARADTLMRRLEVLLSRLNAKEKTAIVVQEYMDGSWEDVNESLTSIDRVYLLYCATCFLEEYLSDKVLRKYYRLTKFKSVPMDR